MKNFKMKPCTALFSLSLVLLACEPQKTKDSKTSDGVAAAAKADLTGALNLTPPSNLENLNQISVIAKLADNIDEFQNREPEPSDPSESCLTTLVNSAKWKGNDTKISYEHNFDAGKCLQESMDAKVESGSQIFSLRFELECSLGGLNQFVGKSVSAAQVSLKPCKGGIATVLQRIEIDTKVKLLQQAESKTISQELDFKASIDRATAKGSACSSELKGDEWVVRDGCMFVGRTVFRKATADGKSLLDTLRNSFIKIESAGVRTKNDPKFIWPVAGQYLVQVGDWTGSVANRSGNQSSMYSLKRGSEAAAGEMPSGDEKAELHLTETKKDPILSLMRVSLQILRP